MAPYRGETAFKRITRVLVWQQHRHLLTPRGFKKTPHIFLASRFAGDVTTLKDMGVAGPNIWAVEKDEEQYVPLFDRCKLEGFHVYPQKVETVIAGHPTSNIRSVYLDYCGNLQGTRGTTRRVVSLLPAGSVLSVTLFLGRELERPEDRESALLRYIRQHTQHQTTVVQSILYPSNHQKDNKASPMGAWTLYLGPLASRAKMRFDLHQYSSSEVEAFDAVELWHERKERSKSRSLAAVRANLTRSLYIPAPP
jgi:hypothetical protein